MNRTHLHNFCLEIHVDMCIHNQTPILYTGLRFCKDWGGICLALSVKIVLRMFSDIRLKVRTHQVCDSVGALLNLMACMNFFPAPK